VSITAGRTVTLIAPANLVSARPRSSTGSAVLSAGLVVVPGLGVLSAWNPLPLTSALLELSALTFALVVLLWKARLTAELPFHALSMSAVALPLIGCAQLALRQAAYPFATIRAVLYWSAVAAMTLAAGWLLAARRSRTIVLSSVGVVGLVATVLELQQIYGYGRYGVTATGYPLLSSNYYAELVELILPVVLTRAFRDQRSWWVFLGFACLMVSTVLSSAARVGSMLVLVECILVTLIHTTQVTSLSRRLKKVGLTFAVLAIASTLLQDPSTLLRRLRETDPLAGRTDITQSTVEMVRSRPLTGYGMGNFSAVYPAFARFDNGYLVNHAHNDWLEAMADGGPLLLAALGVFVAISGFAGIRSVWGLGLVILPLHAVVDFPFQRPAVALLYAVIAATACARSEFDRFGAPAY
jgi:O-antigen ligase